MFRELCKHDDLDSIRNIFSPECDEWFKLGVQDAAAGREPFLTCRTEYHVGYKAYITVKTAVASIPTMMWQRGN